ncbi:hypothetical protein EST38_g13724 [Candolleomyces aberdarensis]|uniref:Uncharacterized protein n=1 Tax=Candolleomyces aberdarensis TaxID=2316362 RepID=A0A4Q2CZ27_9AGAR|nr:hypothetical protein EST38_g13724 [Candolleomyces aberdarensis]
MQGIQHMDTQDAGNQTEMTNSVLLAAASQMAEAPGSLENFRNHELAETLWQLHIQQHLQSLSSSDDPDGDLGQPIGTLHSPKELDPAAGDETFQATPSRIEHIKWTQEFITLIRSATLDNHNLDEATRERLRNPSCPRSDEELAA